MGIQVQGLKKKIGSKVILDNIDYTFEYQKVYGIIGRNGSGKTMFLRSLCGLIVPSAGRITIDGKILHKDMRFAEDMGVIIETPGFWENYTGFENLKSLASIRKMISDEELIQVLQLVGLEDAKDVKYKKYSLGMKQRLAIAQSIMEKPKILLLDEPSNALDEEGIDMLREVIKKVKENGAMVIIASHNKEDIELLSDKVLRMKSGQLTQINEM